MDLFSKAELANLIQEQESPCVSIYLTTHRMGQEVRQDRLRLKNLTDEAEDHLSARGLRTSAIGDLIAPLEALMLDRAFWQRQSDGLAVFLSPGRDYIFRLPVAFDKLMVIGDRFHVKPLLPMLSGDGRFYLLALSQGDVRFFRGTRHTIDEIDLGGLPDSLAHALRFEDPERQLQFHTSTEPPSGSGERAAIFHGHGVGSESSKKDRILRFFQVVDQHVSGFLAVENVPLILAGVDYLLPIYRQVNSYPNLVQAGILGNPEEVPIERLHIQSWDIVEPIFLQERWDAASRFEQLVGSGQASSEIEKVVSAAYHGRVQELFVAIDVQQWGAFDPVMNQVIHHEDAQDGDQDLIDLAAVLTFQNGGTVYAIEREKMPEAGVVAAIFRY